MSFTLAVIHARGGSVRVPLKNIRLLGGHPLIAWSIKAALSSSCDRVLVSTDSPDIAKIAAHYGADVPFLRPQHLSEDVASELVTQHAVDFHECDTNSKVTHCITIQPTTPFITSSDINESLRMISRNTSLDSIFSGVKISQRPEWMFTIDNVKGSRKLLDLTIQGEVGVSQSLPDLWHPNGGIYVTPRELLFTKNRLIGDRPGILPMDLLHSVDIDEEIDFLIAEAVVDCLQLSLSGVD